MCSSTTSFPEKFWFRLCTSGEMLSADMLGVGSGSTTLWPGNTVSSIWTSRPRNGERRCVKYLLASPSVDATLDIIKVGFCHIEVNARLLPRHVLQGYRIKVSADDAIDELNERFRRAGVGYRFGDYIRECRNRLIRFRHSTVISLESRGICQWEEGSGHGSPQRNLARRDHATVPQRCDGRSVFRRTPLAEWWWPVHTAARQTSSQERLTRRCRTAAAKRNAPNGQREDRHGHGGL